jgi:hypothetical protein
MLALDTAWKLSFAGDSSGSIPEVGRRWGGLSAALSWFGYAAEAIRDPVSLCDAEATG